MDVNVSEKLGSVSVFDLQSSMGHEQVIFCHEPTTGLRAIIAIHNTALGPGLGGLRMYPYTSEREALIDVLRLSRGMTYKAAVSGLDLGGAKAVIIGHPAKDKSEALLRWFGRFVDSLGGRYITAEDVGTTTSDMEIISRETDYVTGLPEVMGGGGDPSPITAYGVFLGMKAAVNVFDGSEHLNGKRVLVEGVGKVGSFLVPYLIQDGAEVLVADVNPQRLETITQRYPDVKVVDVDSRFEHDIDIYSPCALGATLNDDTIPILKAKIVAGAANNQLADEDRHGRMLLERGIIYAPDFVVNAGGLINVYTEWNGYDHDLAMARADKIYETTLRILQRALEENTPTHQVANAMAEERIESVGRTNLMY